MVILIGAVTALVGLALYTRGYRAGQQREQARSQAREAGLVAMGRELSDQGEAQQAALQRLGGAEKNDFIATLNLVRFARLVAQVVERVTGSGDMLSEIPTRTTCNIMIGGRVTKGRLDVDVVVPKQHLLELMGRDRD